MADSAMVSAYFFAQKIEDFHPRFLMGIFKHPLFLMLEYHSSPFFRTAQAVIKKGEWRSVSDGKGASIRKQQFPTYLYLFLV